MHDDEISQVQDFKNAWAALGARWGENKVGVVTRVGRPGCWTSCGRFTEEGLPNGAGGKRPSEWKMERGSVWCMPIA